MFGLGKHGPDGRYGVIIDIGSGSVGVALVASDPLEAEPEILWTHRERMIANEDDTLEQASKRITTALINIFLTIGAEGIKALNEHEKNAKLDLIQVAISAPWSYTITKTVSYSRDDEFVVTKKLVEDLILSAQKQALEAIDENDIMRKLGLEIISKATINIAANNYTASQPYNQRAQNLSISHVTAISQGVLLAALAEGKDKVLPKIPLEKHSFMLIFYCVLRRLAPDTSEVCLVDITSEATEIGIVRDGILRYTTHAPFGIYSIARDIVKLCKVPFDEALAYVRGNTALEATLSPSVQEELAIVLEAYEQQIAELFTRTGDALSIPRPLFIHTESRTEAFFADRILKAANSATKSEHGIHLVTEKILGSSNVHDTALLLSSHFFHKMHSCDDFKRD